MFKSFFAKSYNSQDMFIKNRERIRLKNIPRYIPIETELFGYKIVANDACTFLADVNSIFKKGIYNFISKRPEPLIIDCGANIGMSALYFKRLYPKASILAFEPDPQLAKCFQKNIASVALNNVTLAEKAVWIHGEGATFKVEGGHSGAICLDDLSEGNLITVPSVRLKNVLESADYIDFLKLDIEGAEEDVVLDCGSAIGKCDHVFIEYHSNVKKSQSLHKILALMSSLGYRYHVQEAFCRKQPFVNRDCMVEMDLQLNLFFWKNS